MKKRCISSMAVLAALMLFTATAPLTAHATEESSPAGTQPAATAAQTAAETKPAQETTAAVPTLNLTGTGTVITSERAEDGKVFYTIEAADGSVFYLVIDNANMQNNVYFLSPVTEQDLISLAKPDEPETGSGSSIQSIFGIGGGDEPGTSELAPQSGEDTTDVQESRGWLVQNLPFIIIVFIAAVTVGVYYWFKIRKKAQITLPAEYNGPDEPDEFEEEIMENDSDSEE